MIHIALHFVVPLAVAVVFYRERWRGAAVILVATMVVDLDHLLASPIYDPARCSIGFHPLHTLPAIVIFGALFLVPLVVSRMAADPAVQRLASTLHLIGLGLLIHMALDWADCLL